VRSCRPLWLALAMALAAAGCTGGSGGSGSSPHPPPFPRGGTLRVGTFGWYPSYPLDPTSGLGEPGGGWVCCLYRTLYSFNGRPIDEGGSVLRPDLATGPPDVSSDGTIWTIHVKAGLHYAPPLQRVEITAGDFVRSLERMLSPSPKSLKPWVGPLLGGPAAGYFADIIQGASDFSAGKADSISGLETPDPHTLRFRLTRPVGDLDDRLSVFDTAPIPPNPFRPGDRFGVAEGHDTDGYERVLVSSGPYMFEGAQSVDYSKPPNQQQPAPGYETLTLVRNPSWQPATDPLREAYPDRIEFSVAHSKAHSMQDLFESNPAQVQRYTREYSAKVERGEIDTLIDYYAPRGIIARYESDPNLKGRLAFIVAGSIRFLAFNLALPPFDDVHVRKAVNLVLDKDRIAKVFTRNNRPEAVHDHLAPDRQENNLLATYDPYPTPNHGGDVAAARREMAASAYDRNHDGRCDGPACRISAPWRNDPGYLEMAPIVKSNLAEIGITLSPHLEDGFSMYSDCSDHQSHAQLCQVGWAGDYPGAATYFSPLYSSQALGSSGFNYSLTGATPRDLIRWGYPVHQVPDLDGRMNECATKLGQDQVQCWAAFDQYLMEVVVPAVPIMTDIAPRTFSSRVAHFSWDAVTGTPALDNIAMR